MDWSLLASIFWKLSLGVFLIALTILTGYLRAAFGSLRNSLNSIRDTLNSIEDVVNQELSTLIIDANETVKTLNEELPTLLGNLRRVLASWENISESEIRPTMHNVQEMSTALNHSTQELNQLIQKVSHFSAETVAQIAFFRNQLSGLLTKAISLWHGIKAGWSYFVFRQSTPSKSPLSEDSAASEVSAK
ncbi:MAG: hypothetical protein OXU27_18270 [Candidatus Poribacteria bacterium]|nr:hypothetical protein [Candidatus Poribacteria bacterium]